MTTLKLGDKAPQITANDQHGKIFDLSAMKGSKVVLYFYPKDDTPDCTAQACNLKDNYNDLLARGYKVVGVSPDDIKSHLKFSEKFELPFPLLPDPEKVIINAYGVWGTKKFLGNTYNGVNRTTFIIDENGNIERIIEKVNTKNHSEQIIS